MAMVFIDTGRGSLKVQSENNGNAQVTLMIDDGQIIAPWSVFRELVIPVLRTQGYVVAAEQL